MGMLGEHLNKMLCYLNKHHYSELIHPRRVVPDLKKITPPRKIHVPMGRQYFLSFKPY